MEEWGVVSTLSDSLNPSEGAEAPILLLGGDGQLSYEEQMFGGLIPPNEGHTPEQLQMFNENLLYLLERVSDDLLTPENKSLLQCLKIYREETEGKGILTEDVLVDMLIRSQVPPEKQVLYQEMYLKYSQLNVSQGKFRWCLKRFLTEKEEVSFVKIINDSFTIQRTGMKVGRKELKGYHESRAYLSTQLAQLDLKSGISEISEGDFRTETEESIIEYNERKVEPAKFVGVKCGLSVIDDLTNGAQAGELWVIGGYTEVGKTFWLINAAHYAATEQGKNVVIATGEVVYKQLRRRFYLRHARNQKFGLPFGIDADAFKKATLTPQEEKAYAAAMDDFKTNRNYGRVYVFQIPRGADLPFIHNKLTYINSLFPVHALYMDSLNLLIHSKGDNVRQVANQTIKDAKQMAVTFDKQRGIPFYTPWHANRSSWEKAKEKGFYDLNSWVEADELERSADMLLWLLKLENAQDTREIQGGINKYRDGRSIKQFTLYQDYASSYLGTVAAGQVRSQNSPPQTLGDVVSATVETHNARGADLF